MKRIIIILLCVLGLAACKRQSQATSESPQIMVTIEPLRYFAEQLSDGRYEIQSMVPTGMSPENYDPTPQQIIDFSKCSAYFGIGHIGFEQNWMKRLTDNAPHLPVFNLSRNIPLITKHDDDETSTHSNDWTTHHHHRHNVDPHTWCSPGNASIIVNNLCDAFCRIDPIHETAYRSKRDSMQNVIQHVDEQIRDILDEQHFTFLIYHPALTYFAQEYGLTQVSIEHDGKEPSPATLQEIINLCKSNTIKVIFVQEEFDVHHAALIARETNVRIVTINPLSYDWANEMLNIAQQLAQ